MYVATRSYKHALRAQTGLLAASIAVPITATIIVMMASDGWKVRGPRAHTHEHAHTRTKTRNARARMHARTHCNVRTAALCGATSAVCRARAFT